MQKADRKHQETDAYEQKSPKVCGTSAHLPYACTEKGFVVVTEKLKR